MVSSIDLFSYVFLYMVSIFSLVFKINICMEYRKEIPYEFILSGDFRGKSWLKNIYGYSCSTQFIIIHHYCKNCVIMLQCKFCCCKPFSTLFFQVVYYFKGSIWAIIIWLIIFISYAFRINGRNNLYAVV